MHHSLLRRDERVTMLGRVNELRCACCTCAHCVFFRKDERNTRCIGFPFLSRVLSLCVDDNISMFNIRIEPKEKASSALAIEMYHGRVYVAVLALPLSLVQQRLFLHEDDENFAESSIAVSAVVVSICHSYTDSLQKRRWRAREKERAREN
jgi:hypothetical protein